MQTDYRETEAQTDPYSPEEIYREGDKPEVLYLKKLTYGNGTFHFYQRSPSNN